MSILLILPLDVCVCVEVSRGVGRWGHLAGPHDKNYFYTNCRLLKLTFNLAVGTVLKIYINNSWY